MRSNVIKDIFNKRTCERMFLKRVHLKVSFFLSLLFSFFLSRFKWQGQRGDCNTHRDWSDCCFLLGLAHPHLLQCETGQRSSLITVCVCVFVSETGRRWWRLFNLWLTAALSAFECCLIFKRVCNLPLKESSWYLLWVQNDLFATVRLNNKQDRNEALIAF